MKLKTFDEFINESNVVLPDRTGEMGEVLNKNGRVITRTYEGNHGYKSLYFTNPSHPNYMVNLTDSRGIPNQDPPLIATSFYNIKGGGQKSLGKNYKEAFAFTFFWNKNFYRRIWILKCFWWICFIFD